MDLAVTANNVLKGAGSQIQTVTAGVALTAGQYVYLDASNVAQLSDSDGAAATNAVSGVTANAAGAGQPVVIISPHATIPITTGFTALAGDVIYLSDTPGGATKTFADLEAGDVIITLGVMKTTTTMIFYPIIGGAIAA